VHKICTNKTPFVLTIIKNNTETMATNNADSTQRLDNDCLLNIFQTLVDDSFHVKPLSPVWKLASVSRRWRGLSMNSHRLWSTIVADDRRRERKSDDLTINAIKLSIARSGEVALRVRLRLLSLDGESIFVFEGFLQADMLEERENHDLIDTISSSAHRWAIGSLIMTPEALLLLTNVSIAFGICKSFKVGSSADYMDSIPWANASFPSLTSLDVVGVTINVSSLSAVTRLIVSQSSMREVFSMVKACPILRDLTVRCPPLFEDADDFYNNPPKIIHPTVTKFTIIHHNDDIDPVEHAQIAEYIELPSLVEASVPILDLDINGEFLRRCCVVTLKCAAQSHALYTFHRLENVTTLVIYAQNTWREIFRTLGTEGVAPRLRHLETRFTHDPWVDTGAFDLGLLKHVNGMMADRNPGWWRTLRIRDSEVLRNLEARGREGGRSQDPLESVTFGLGRLTSTHILEGIEGMRMAVKADYKLYPSSDFLYCPS
jgi:hypothetical protein